MSKYKLILELLSDALPGSGEGFGAVIDQDIVFDDLGIPYIPGKRIKGLLRDSYEGLMQLVGNSLSINKTEELFGKPGQPEPAPLFISNLYPEDYDNLKNVLICLNKKYPEVFAREAVLEAFTYVRNQTAINDKGVALEHSLRSIRVLKKGLKFIGTIEIDEKKVMSNTPEFLGLACLYLKRIGTKRTRGFGEVKCYLTCDNGKNLIDKALIESLLSGGNS